MQQLVQMQFNFQQVVVKDDPNRELMIKFKYNTITESQLQQLRKQLHKLIYDIIRKNYVNMDCRDVYQEIWKKIIKSKHSWNENIGTKVSTWIVWVCLSVINGLRMRQKKYSDRYSLYQDFVPQSQQNNNIDSYQSVLFSSGLVDQKPFQRMYFNEEFEQFVSGLNDIQRDIINLVLSVDSQKLNKEIPSRYVKKKITKSYIKDKLKLKQKQFGQIMQNLKKKFHDKIVLKRS